MPGSGSARRQRGAAAAARSFAPIAGAAPRVLILGSLPGTASLAAGEYYAHPRNAFWPIMGALFGAGPALAYEERVKRLQACGIAVWDVIGSGRRRGSLDASIESEGLVVNDIAGFVADHPGIGHIFFNGTAAETCFRRHLPALRSQPGLRLCRLPSTSPAHAGMSYAEKLDVWRVVASGLDD